MNKTSQEVFQRHVAQTSRSPIGLEITDAKGCYLYDSNGNTYLDLIAGITVCNLGHQHPAVTTAIRQQLDHYTFTMVYGEFIQESQIAFARLLAKQLPPPLESTYFVSSGSEAIEGALKLAKLTTGRQNIIAFHGGYHGSTHGAMSIMGDKVHKKPFAPLLPHIEHIPFNNEGSLSKITGRTAAAVVEPIQGEAGVRLPGQHYLKKLRARCDETGTQLIFDECQTGFGRTGKLFAFQQYGVTPDILVAAKAMGGGMPLGGFTASHPTMQHFTDKKPLGHLTTFGGHPVSCAAGHAHLKTLLNDNLIEQVPQKAARFKKLLQHDAIRSVRHQGLFFALEFDREELVHKVAQICLENGVLVHWFLFDPKSIRIAPPLIIDKKEIEQGATVILESIEKALQ